MLVLVHQMWVNPARVVAVYVNHHNYEGSRERWQVTLACTDKKEWSWSFYVEEEAYAWADKLAEQVNQQVHDPFPRLVTPGEDLR